jgi:surface protein
MDITSYLLGKQAGGGGGDVSLQTNKDVTITSNGQTTVNPDEGYDAIKKVSVTTNVPAGADLNEYFYSTIDSNTSSANKAQIIKKAPNMTISNNVTDLTRAFVGFSFGNSIPKLIGGQNVTTLFNMFADTSNLQNLDLSEFDITNVSSMENMFSNSKIQSLTFKNKVSNKARVFTNMFSNCANLTTLDLGIETYVIGGGSPTNRVLLNGMFNSCTLLTELDLSGLIINTNIYNTSNMFNGCTNLTKIDIRNLKIDGNIYSYNGMFNYVPDNCLIIVKDDTAKTWITSKFTNLTNVKIVSEL